MTDIISILKQTRFSIDNEKTLQLEIEQAIKQQSIAYIKEYTIDTNSIIDFLLRINNVGIGIEVKIKGRRREIYKQLSRYAECEHIDQIVLLTSLSIGLPARIANKPVTVINISRAWL